MLLEFRKDINALDLIIESLKNQTYKNFEVIISEDGNSDEMREYIQTIEGIEFKHLSQPDIGWRKNRMLNQAIITTITDYLIFIDGDCIPDKKFIEEHIQLKKDNVVLCGRRTEPGAYYSNVLRKKQISIDTFRDDYIKNYFKLKKDDIRHYEEGIYCKPSSLLGKLATLKTQRKEVHLVGCHWSCHKKELLKINGFDEDFELPTTGEDTDIERRLRYFGVEMKSCRNFAILTHLYHEKNFNPEIASKTEALMNTKLNEFICKNGILKY